MKPNVIPAKYLITLITRQALEFVELVTMPYLAVLHVMMKILVLLVSLGRN